MTKRKRHQKGSLQEALSGSKRVWKALYYDESGVRKSVILGECSKISKSVAQTALAEILAPINQARQLITKDGTVADYVKYVFIPYGKEKWRDSTTLTNERRLDFYMIRGEFGKLKVSELNRTNMQALLNLQVLKAKNTINAIRRDLSSICKLAFSEGLIKFDQSVNLFIPKEAKKPVQTVLTIEQVLKIRSVLELRARVFFDLAIYAGIRPGEIIALKWSDLVKDSILVDDRFYQGKQDKTKNGKDREVALSSLVMIDLSQWKQFSIGSEFVFPSEKIAIPMRYENIMKREIKPKLKGLGLDWIDYRVLRRTNATLMHVAKVDAKVSADNRGHGLQVSMDEYTHSTMDQKRQAVQMLQNLMDGTIQ